MYYSVPCGKFVSLTEIKWEIKQKEYNWNRIYDVNNL